MTDIHNTVNTFIIIAITINSVVIFIIVIAIIKNVANPLRICHYLLLLHRYPLHPRHLSRLCHRLRCCRSNLLPAQHNHRPSLLNANINTDINTNINIIKNRITIVVVEPQPVVDDEVQVLVLNLVVIMVMITNLPLLQHLRRLQLMRHKSPMLPHPPHKCSPFVIGCTRVLPHHHENV